MKKLITFIALLWAGAGFAQIPFEIDEIVEADGITYEVKQISMFKFVNNINNTYLEQANWRYKNGEELSTVDEYKAAEAHISIPNEYKAIREAFGDELIAALRAYEYSQMRIMYAVSSEGETLEVAFFITAAPELNELPLTTLAALERNLKKYATWSLNDFAKKLEFVHVKSFIFFKNVPLSTETRRINPDLEVAPGRGLETPPGEEATEVPAE